MKAIAEFAKEAMELPPVQRLTLARLLIESSEGNRDFSPEAEAAWDAEIGRRVEAVKAGAAQSRTASEVFADLDRRFPS